jgi:hypothetical protein
VVERSPSPSLVLFLIACCFACSSSTAGDRPGDGGPPPDGAAPADGAPGDAISVPDVDPTTADGFCRGYFAILADIETRCSGAAAAGVAVLYSDPLPPCQRFASSIAGGRTAFDGSGAAACLAGLAAYGQSCGTDMSQVAACDSVITPLVPVGGTCQSYYLINVSPECAGDAFCNEGANQACSGACVMRSPLGTPCDPLTTDVRCTAGTTCDTANTKTCVTAPTPGAADQPCTGSGRGSCARGLYCDSSAGDGGSTGVCRAQRQSGACASSAECASPTHCAGAAGAQTCAPIKAVGDACTPGWGECAIFSFCVDVGGTNRCSDTGRAVGDPCGAINGESVACVTGAFCDAPPLGTGTCVLDRQPGDDCTGTALLGECSGNGGHCDSTTHKCVTCAF